MLDPDRLDVRAWRRERRRNRAVTALLLATIIAALLVPAAAFFGLAGIVWVTVLGFGASASYRSASAPTILRRSGARPVPRTAAPRLHAIVEALSQRAGLPRAPELHLLPGPVANALATGHPRSSAIAVTGGLLRDLSERELVGVLAHEVAHIRAGDLWIAHLAATIGRATSMLVHVALLLVIFVLPLGAVPSGALFALALAPTVVTLASLALSRRREHEADLAAVGLTGDPVGLANALDRLERSGGRWWERLVPGRHRGNHDAWWLRTHPPTAERVRRLYTLLPQSHTRSSRHDSPRRTSSYTPRSGLPF